MVVEAEKWALMLGGVLGNDQIRNPYTIQTHPEALAKCASRSAGQSQAALHVCILMLPFAISMGTLHNI